MGKLIYDNFSDVFAFREAIQSRPNNEVMRGENASSKGKRDFAGMPLNDAYKALTDGIPEAAENLKRDLKKFQAKAATNIPQRRPINYYNGHSPNVPAAIIGLPKSMRKTVKTPSKIKTVTLYYNSSENAGTSAETLEKSGAAVLQLVYWLELNGYRVKFCLVPYLAESGDENAVCNVLLKDFRQPLDILKLSFSITSVSMFRRLGFRWLETVPNITERSWSFGYGHQISDKDECLELLRKTGQNVDNAYFIKVSDCKNVDFDPVRLASDLGIKAG